MKRYTYKNITLSAKEWAEELEISKDHFRKRVANKALTDEERFSPRKTKNKQRFLYMGETLTLKEVSERSGIPYSTLCERVRNGINIEQAAAETKSCSASTIAKIQRIQSGYKDPVTVDAEADLSPDEFTIIRMADYWRRQGLSEDEVIQEVSKRLVA